jgi:hypothetical protein
MSKGRPEAFRGDVLAIINTCIGFERQPAEEPRRRRAGRSF